MTALRWIKQDEKLTRDGQAFDPYRLEWTADGSSQDHPSQPVTPVEALSLLGERGLLRRVPVGIIGPREATPAQCALAEKLGEALAKHGLQLLCGGKSGVMEAACKGHAAGGGLPIGILPDDEWQAANAYVAIPIATGLGPARNAIIARACMALVAIGGGVGTLSEIALGLQFNRLVLATADAPPVSGVPLVADVDDILERIAKRVFSFA